MHWSAWFVFSLTPMTWTRSGSCETTRSMTLRECVLAYVDARPGSDDEQIAGALGIYPVEVSRIVCALRIEGLLCPA